MKCYLESCKKKGTEQCNDCCPVYVILESLYIDSNIPKIYQYEKPLKPHTNDKQAFMRIRKFGDEILENIQNGVNLYLYSTITGNGKTSIACKMAQLYFKKIVFSNDLDNQVLFVTVPDLLEEIRTNYDNLDNIVDRVKNAKLVIFDDLGAEKPSEWVRERLYTIINYRVNNGLSSIYTSNMSIETLEINLGNRIGSRLKANTQVIELKGTDRRGFN
ncbi:MAG: ATP-binding protein [Cetobacterium sp.]